MIAMKIKYVVFRQKASYGWASHFGLYKHEDVMIDRNIDNKVLAAINRIHTAARMNKHIQLPLQSVWYRYYLKENELDRKDSLIFLFEDGSRTCFSAGYIKYLKKKYPNAHFVFAALNSSFRYPRKRLKFIEDNYDLITSFDRKDCRDRGWALYTGVYSRLDCYVHTEQYESDVLFIGADKGRLSLIHEIYDRFSAAGLRCDFTVTNVKKKDMIADSGIKYNQWVDYKEVVRRCCHTRCLLDVVQEGQDGATYRQGEAVAYGVKLLTNYHNVVKERYYNSKQMQIFHTVNDINIDFILEPYTSQEFPYNGSLDPYKRLIWLKEKFEK